MAYPIFATRPDRTTLRGGRAFTLVEVMIGAGLGAFILGGVLTTFVMIGRVVTNAGNYCDLDAQARRGLEVFGREVRSASGVAAVNANGTTGVTLTVPDTNLVTAHSYTVTYQYISDPNNPGQYILQRSGPPLSNPFNADGTVNTNTTVTTLIGNVQPGSLSFSYFQVPADGQGETYAVSPETPMNPAPTSSSSSTTLASIKQIEVTLTALRSNVTVVNATNVVLSACFTLRKS
jgi:Tfp pilus assembly protein PilW